jgi:hypothetical protein
VPPVNILTPRHVHRLPLLQAGIPPVEGLWERLTIRLGLGQVLPMPCLSRAETAGE